MQFSNFGMKHQAPRMLLGLACLALAGCGTSLNRAPVEDRVVGGRTASPPAVPTVPVAPPAVPRPTASGPAAVVPAPRDDGPKPLPGAENAGKPGYHTVRPGETLIRIALENGQNWRDVARWSGLENPNLIEVGQVLRVLPPGETGVAVARPVAPAGRIETRPLEGQAQAPSPPPPPTVAGPGPSAGTAGAGPASGTAAGSAPAAPAAAARANEDEPAWGWPAGGPILASFDEARNVKGLAIGGKAGDPVLAAADGRVVYAGSGLRGYGNLVIVKHNNTFLTAYAHNQSLLVKEDQVVRKGQKIAEMGSSDADRVQLHFEIRRQGRPVDPARSLPPR